MNKRILVLMMALMLILTSVGIAGAEGEEATSLGVQDVTRDSAWQPIFVLQSGGEVQIIAADWSAWTYVGATNFLSNLDDYHGLVVEVAFTEDVISSVYSDGAQWKFQQALQFFAQDSDNNYADFGSKLAVGTYKNAYAMQFSADDTYKVFVTIDKLKNSFLDKAATDNITNYNVMIQAGQIPVIVKDVKVATGHVLVEDTYWDENGNATQYKPAKAATATEDGYTGDMACGFCGKHIAGKVIHASTKVVDDKDASCTETGYTGDSVCGVCGEVVETGSEIAKTEHTKEDIEVLEPTCEEAGHSSGSKCSVCGAYIVEPDVVQAVGHEYDEETHKCIRCGLLDPDCCEHETKSLNESSVKDATCTEDGYTGDIYCDACHKVMEAGETIPALGHTEETIAAVAATCTKAGSTEGKKCSVCDKVLVEVKEVAATDHSFGDYVVTKEATVDAAGEKTATCSVCGEKDVKSIDKLPAPETEESQAPTDSKNDGGANTADSMNVAIISVLALLAAAGVVVASKKRA